MAEYHQPKTNTTNNLVLTLEPPVPPRTTTETLRISELGLATAAALLSRPAAMTTITTTTATSTPYSFDLPTSSYNTTNNDYTPIGARKKSTSFQITSVVSSHASNDGADDSADDMDDSHAEDGSDLGDNNSSKCAETPSASCSEDAYSRSEDGLATVAPPFIQVTPAHHPQDTNSVTISESQSVGARTTTSAVSPSSALAPPPVASTPSSSSSAASSAGNPPEAGKAAPSEADKDQQWQTRFKVVKIESQEPFRRGRWLCMDFLDHPSIQPSLSREESGSNNSSNASSVHYVPGENPIAEHPLGQLAEEPVLVGLPAGHPSQHPMHAAPVQSVPTSAVLPQATPLQANFLPNTSTHYAAPGATYSPALPSVAPPVVSFAVTNPAGAYSSTVYPPGAAPVPSYPNPTVYPPTGGAIVPPAHYTSQPAPIGVYASGAPVPQFVTPPIAVVAPVAQVLPPQNYPAYGVATSFAPAPSSSTAFQAYAQAPASYTATPIPQPAYVPSATPVSTYAAYQPPQAYVPPASSVPTYAAAVTSTPTQFVVPPVAMATAPPVSTPSVAETASKVVLPAAVSVAPATIPILLPQTALPIAVTSTSSTSASSIPISSTVAPPPTTVAAAPLLPTVMGDEGIGGEEPNSTAGSTVAIDNKIEQAMDLVKSHLMYAVREEVEVLKERIAELLDRISVLETENSILKASAPQEVLAELSSAVEDQHYNSQSSPAPPQGPPSSTNN